MREPKRGDVSQRGRLPGGRTWALLIVLCGLVMAVVPSVSASAAIVQKKAWGSGGAGAGQLAFSEGIATDANHHVYVADTGNDRIQKFSASGRFLLAWGWGVKDGQSRLETCRSSCQTGIGGPGAGQLGAPNGVAPDGRGHVYVADTGEDRIEEFSPSGGLLDSWGSAGSGPGRFDSPVDVAIGRAGQVYVADFFNLRIQRFTRHGRYLGQWPAPYPYGLASDSSGNLYAAEYYDDRVEKFSATGRFLRVWGWGVRTGDNRFERCGPRPGCSTGIQGSGKGEFASPTAVATDPAHRVYVADSSNDRIQKFSAGGRFLTTWGEFGHSRGQFDYPAGVAVDAGGHVYVVDEVNQRIVKYAQVPPRTTITGSKVSDARSRAKFRFRSSEPGSRFSCKLDHRRFHRCHSPRVYRPLSVGTHTFKVRATGAGRLTDPTPAKKRFRLSK
jgi:tripartite motif-containing protein 71